MSEETFEQLLAACASEPIHAPGAVQPHGALFVVDDGVVRSLSANAAALLGVDVVGALGRPLDAVLGARWSAALDEALATDGIATVEHDGTTFECLAARTGDVTLFEVEPHPGEDLADGRSLFHALDAFHGARSVDELVRGAVTTVAQLTGFDRVVCYRFDSDWHGEVVAEAIVEGVDSFAGLRFPASDIPPQARAQYERLPLRLIPDADAAPVPLVAEDPTWIELDISDATLRAVSPVHLTYLANMGVRSSMSVSLVVDGRLWGLIACHHCSEVVRPSHRVRQAVRLVARTTSTVLAVLLSAERTERHLARVQQVDRLAGLLREDEQRPALEVLLDHPDALLALVDANGAVVCTPRGCTPVGAVPGDVVLQGLTARLAGSPEGFADDAIGAGDGPAGVLAAPVAGAADAWIMWFRPETAETVRWAGRPAKEADVATGRLEPRSSFAAYVEEVRGRSVPWSEAELDVARDLARRIAESDSLRARREADMAARLQRALMLEAFPPGRGMRGAAHYQPVSNSPLGGDWYDVFYLPDGRSIVAVGDVAGHGFEVAAAMAQLRHALRAFLVRVPSFEQALERLDEVITTLLPAEMATVVLAEVDAETRSVRLANAGHLPVVVASPSGARLIEVPGPSLGWDSDKPHPAVPVPMAPGERLVMATDGLIERRSRTIDLGLEALRVAAAESAHLGVEEQAARLVETLTDGTDVDDDVTVVVVELDAG